MECDFNVMEDRRFLEAVVTFDYETMINMVRHDELKEFCKLMNTPPTSTTHKRYTVSETCIPATLGNENMASQKKNFLQQMLSKPVYIDARSRPHDEGVGSTMQTLNVVQSKCKPSTSTCVLLSEQTEEVMPLEKDTEEVICKNATIINSLSRPTPCKISTMHIAKEKDQEIKIASKNDIIREIATCSGNKNIKLKEHTSTYASGTSLQSLINKGAPKRKNRFLQSHKNSNLKDFLNGRSSCNTSYARRYDLGFHVQKRHNVKSKSVRKSKKRQINSEENIFKSSGFLVKSNSSDPIYTDAHKVERTHGEGIGTTIYSMKGKSKLNTSQGVLLEENTEENVSDNATTQKLTSRETPCVTPTMNYKPKETKEHNVKLMSKNCTVRDKATCSSDKDAKQKEHMPIKENAHRCKKTFSETNVKGHRYKCSFCVASYVNSHGLKRHLKTKHKNSSDERNYTEVIINGKLKEVLKLEYNDMNIDSVTYDVTSEECPICKKTEFKPLARLREHIQCHTNVARYKCGYCSRILKKEKYFISHIKTHDHLLYGDSGNKKNVTCNSEDHEEVNKQEGPHMSYNGPVQKFFQCNICQEKFSDIEELRIHFVIHECSSAETVECKTCRKPFLTTTALQHHCKKMHNKGIYECFHCGESFESSNAFSNHCLESHLEKRAFRCDECDKTYATSSSLNKHRYYSHSDKFPSRNMCSKCGKTFLGKNRLKRHMLIHSKGKPYQCDKCGKHFVNACRLRYHYSVHTGDKPFVCETCGKQFRTKLVLHSHLSSHSDARPYKCESCGKDYKLKMHLEKHMLLHTGKMKHKCKICGRKFVEKNKLDSHVRAHRGEKPFECKTCGKAFQDKFPFQRHMLTHKNDV